ncbi:sigma-70 family RNA polymerase sigma factor [Streptomyces sp. NPDC058989]|uniref:sigma-70 family RNA polymerase sigma factor n=1 Tax=Streptomyces sp. NPDC058989 TaxID=3346686 RepID=UPI0036B47EA5
MTDNMHPLPGRTDPELTAVIAKEHDEQALTELYQHHRAAILAYARTCCRDAHTAEDLASEAFARTIRAVRMGRGPETAWRPYLLVVVRRTAAEWAETARHTELTDDFEDWLGEASQSSDDEGGEQRALRMEDGRLVLQAFRSLPERWQMVLWHTVVEEESPAEVGALLGITASGVGSLAARAREGLREAYLAAHVQGSDETEECRHYSALLAAAVRRSGRRRSRDLERHLATCARCRRAAEELTDLNTRMRLVLSVGVLLFGGPAYLASRIAGAEAAKAALAQGATRSADPAQAGETPWWSRVVVAAVMAFAAMGLLLLPHERHDRAVPPSEEQGSPQQSGAPQPEPGSGGPTGSQAAEPEPSQPASSAPDREARRPSKRPKPPAASGIPTPPHSPGMTPGGGEGASHVVIARTGWCMEVPDDIDSQPREAECDDGERRQSWTLRPLGGDADYGLPLLQLRNDATHLCLTHSGTAEPNGLVRQRPCDSSDRRQTWMLGRDRSRGVISFRVWHEAAWLGLNDVANAAQGAPHDPRLGTNGSGLDDYDDLWADFFREDVGTDDE